MTSTTISIDSAPTPRATATPPRRRVGTIARLAAMIAVAFFTLGPVLWTLYTSFTPLDPATGRRPWSLSAYADVFSQVDMWFLIWNSVLVTAIAAAGQMLTAGLGGYIFARVPFRGRGVLFAGILATMMVPVPVIIVPVFVLIRGMGLADTLLALILPAIPTAFGVFLMRQQYMQLPGELGEAATVDGAGPMRTYFSIYLPLSRPGLAVVGILAFNFLWNEFFRPLIMVISQENFTLPLGLVTLKGNLGTGNVATVLAGVMISIIPALLVFIIGNRTLREGLTAGAVK